MNPLLFALVSREAVVMFGQEVERRNKYRTAEETSQIGGKGLLVVGGPYGAKPYRRLFGFQAHGCGDV